MEHQELIAIPTHQVSLVGRSYNKTPYSPLSKRSGFENHQLLILILVHRFGSGVINDKQAIILCYALLPHSNLTPTTRPDSGPSSRMAQKGCPQGVRVPIQCVDEMGRNHNTQPDSATPFRSAPDQMTTTNRTLLRFHCFGLVYSHQLTRILGHRSAPKDQQQLILLLIRHFDTIEGTTTNHPDSSMPCLSAWEEQPPSRTRVRQVTPLRRVTLLC